MTQILQGRPAIISNGSTLKQLDNPAELRKNADVLSNLAQSLRDQADALENERKIQGKNKKTVVCHFYNEEFLLPWWLTHHSRIFDHGIMIDYQSTDRSVELIKEICPTWEIRPSKNEYFHAGKIDDEVMEIERELEGWRIALNVPEFLYGNINQLNNYDDEENKQFLLGNYVFVDMEDADKEPVTLDHNIPLHDQRYWGYVEDKYDGWQSENGSTRRLNRSIHNYALQYPDWGRHYPKTVTSFKDLVIFYYGWAYIGPEGIARKMQIKTKLPPDEFRGCHHDKDEAAMFRQYRDDQKPRATDLREAISPILEHNQYKLGKFEMIKYEYIYKEEHLKYIFEQQHEVQLANNDLDMYADLSVHEFSQFKQHIGNPRVVFEAGCGIGRGSVYLNHLLQDNEVEYILADRTGWHWTNQGNLTPNNDDVYNDLSMTADFSSLNGIKKFKTFDTQADDWNSLTNVDLIFSLCSFGMHVSIEAYIDRLINISHSNTTMIFGTRSINGVEYGPTSFQDRFQQVIFIPGQKGPERTIKFTNGDGLEQERQVMFPFENWLILKNPIK